MLDILVRAGSFVFIILLGYGLKRIGFFKEADFTLLSRITIRITLSAAIICNLASVQIEPSLLSLALLGIGGGILYILGDLFGRRRQHCLYGEIRQWFFLEADPKIPAFLGSLYLLSGDAVFEYGGFEAA